VIDTKDLADRLRAVEENLRDLAYDCLRQAAEGDEDAAREEKRILKARRAVEKAIHELDPVDHTTTDPDF
jgi:hypothetical protein